MQGYGKRIILKRANVSGADSFCRFQFANGDIVILFAAAPARRYRWRRCLFGLQSARGGDADAAGIAACDDAPAATWPPGTPGSSAIPATAAAYYLNVLKGDPRNAELLSRAFLSVLTDGEIDEAGRLADRLLQIDRNDRIARLVSACARSSRSNTGVARQNFAQSVRGRSPT